MARAYTRHGKSRTVEYFTWNHMKQRCYDALPGTRTYNDYQGRGITVCSQWRNSFATFLRDVGPRPGPGYSLDRIRNNKGYFPGNVRWANRKQQQRNRRNNRMVTFNGRTATLCDLAEEFGHLRGTVYARVFGRGWPIEKALCTPVRPWRDRVLKNPAAAEART